MKKKLLPAAVTILVVVVFDQTDAWNKIWQSSSGGLLLLGKIVLGFVIVVSGIWFFFNEFS